MTSSAAEGEGERPTRRARAGDRAARFLRFLLVVTAIVHVPVMLAVTEAAMLLGVSRPWIVGIAWAASGAALFVGRARAGMPDRRRSPVVVRVLDVPYFIHWCAAVWAFVPSVVATAVSPLVELARGAPLHLPMGWYLGSYASGIVVCGYGVLVRRRWFRVIEREVRLVGLDPRLDGLRVAHLSDLHVGTFTPRAWGLKWARAANERAPDLAVVTGDMVTSGTEFHEHVADVVSALRATIGIFVSMGNHDYFGEGEPLISLLQARGVRVLRNEGVTLEHAGARFWLAAIDDTWTRRDDLSRALRDRPEGLTTVLLAHDPERFDAAAAKGVDLVLSGHTHGGQIAMPFASRAFGLANLAHRYRVGFYRLANSVLYVHPGLGTTGPPLRLGVAPEVTLLVLRTR